MCISELSLLHFFERREQGVEDGFDIYGHEEKKLRGKSFYL